MSKSCHPQMLLNIVFSPTPLIFDVPGLAEAMMALLVDTMEDHLEICHAEIACRINKPTNSNDCAALTHRPEKGERERQR